MERKINAESFEIKHQKITRLIIPTVAGYTLIDSRDILYLNAIGSATEIFSETEGKIVSSKNLGHYEAELGAEPFVRIHDKTIVNFNKIKSYIKADNGWVLLQNGLPLKVSAGRRDDLLLFFRGGKK